MPFISFVHSFGEAKMSDYPNKEVVDMLMEKVKKYAALSRLEWPAEAKEIEEDIENSLYMVLGAAFDDGHTQGGVQEMWHPIW